MKRFINATVDHQPVIRMSCDEIETFGEKLDDIMGRAIVRAVSSVADEFKKSLLNLPIPDSTGKVIDEWMKEHGHENESHVSIESGGSRVSTQLWKEKDGKFFVSFETERWAESSDDSDEIYKKFPKYMRDEMENLKKFLCLTPEQQKKWLVF